MNRLVLCFVAGAVLMGGALLMIARAQQPGPVLISGDHPVTAEEVEAKLKAGWPPSSP